MQTQRLMRECYSVILEGKLYLKQLSQLVSTIPVSVGIFCIIGGSFSKLSAVSTPLRES